MSHGPDADTRRTSPSCNQSLSGLALSPTPRARFWVSWNGRRPRVGRGAARRFWVKGFRPRSTPRSGPGPPAKLSVRRRVPAGAALAGGSWSSARGPLRELARGSSAGCGRIFSLWDGLLPSPSSGGGRARACVHGCAPACTACARVYAHMCTCVCTRVHVRAHTHVHVHERMCVHVRVRARVWLRQWITAADGSGIMADADEKGNHHSNRLCRAFQSRSHFLAPVDQV